jgi:DNA-binding transcriptional LysR family regulator
VTTPNLRNVDLNLLVPLHALLTERNVTRAAERILVGQSAMSVSLAKLRRILGDPLLVKDGRRMILTPLAESLVDQVGELMTDITSVLDAGTSFDPLTDHRGFTLIGSDYAMQMLLSPLLRELGAVAPHVRLTILPLQIDHIDAVRQGQHDLLVWPADIAGVDVSALSSRTLFTETFVGVVADDHPGVGDRLTVEQLSTLPCIEVKVPGQSLTETGFAELNMPRRVVATAETFTAAANMVAGTRMYAVVQRRLARRLSTMAGLRTVEVDVPLPMLVEAMYWNPRVTANPAHRWLRSTVAQLAARLD